MNADVVGDCYEPQDAGAGFEYEARWSYNADKAQCEPFYYTLQGGNNNNFHAYEDCLAMCVTGGTVHVVHTFSVLSKSSVFVPSSSCGVRLLHACPVR